MHRVVDREIIIFTVRTTMESSKVFTRKIALSRGSGHWSRILHDLLASLTADEFARFKSAKKILSLCRVADRLKILSRIHFPVPFDPPILRWIIVCFLTSLETYMYVTYIHRVYLNVLCRRIAINTYVQI